MNNKKKEILWWLNKNYPTHPLCPNLNIFRFLKLNNFNFKEKNNVLDIGFGNGENLLELKKRCQIIYGIDIRNKLLNYFVKKNKLNKKNFYVNDLRASLPTIKNKFQLILMIDVLCYLNSDNQKNLFKWVDKQLYKGGLFLFSYTQNDLILKRKKDRDNWEVSKKFYKINKINFDKKNPMKFLELKKIMPLFKDTQLNFLASHFDISTYSKKDSSKIRIGRYILMKKKN